MLPSEEIKEKINIAELIGEHVSLKKAGTNFRSLCPFHQEKTPSFMVSPVKQIWHCFGCGLGGDVFEFVKLMEGVEFPEALQILANRAGVVLKKPAISYQKDTDQKRVLYEINELAAKFFVEVLDKSSLALPAREYLTKRGLRSETVKTWGLGWAPDDFHTFENFIVKRGFQKKEAAAAGLLVQREDASVQESEDRFFDRFRGRLMFPLHDIHGRVVGFTARIFNESRPEPVEGPVPAKYVNSPETLIYSKSRVIYGLDKAKSAIRQQNQVIIVEGNMDVIACHEAGYKNAVASSGTALSETQLLTLKRFTENISFAFDVDEAGLMATRRAVEMALHAGFNVKVIRLPKSLAKDPDELLRKDVKLWGDLVQDAQFFLDFYFDSIFATMGKDLTNLEKKQAASEILSLLVLVPEPIERAHYVQKLSQRIGADEKLILELLNQKLAALKPGVQKPLSERPSPKISRSELLQRRALGLLLKYPVELKREWARIDGTDFNVQFLRELFEKISPLAAAERFEVQEFLHDNPHLESEVNILVFAVENELAFAGEAKLEDISKNFLGEFKQDAVKRKMRELTSQIRQAEAIGRGVEAKTLSNEFNNLSKDLSKLIF